MRTNDTLRETLGDTGSDDPAEAVEGQSCECLIDPLVRLREFSRRCFSTMARVCLATSDIDRSRSAELESDNCPGFVAGSELVDSDCVVCGRRNGRSGGLDSTVILSWLRLTSRLRCGFAGWYASSPDASPRLLAHAHPIDDRTACTPPTSRDFFSVR